MADKSSKKDFKFNGQVITDDPSKIIPEIKNSLGLVVVPASYGRIIYQPGETISMDEVEGNRLLKILGPYVPLKPLIVTR